MLGGLTIHPPLQISYRYMCQKLWKLADSRQSYCKNCQAYFFCPPCIATQGYSRSFILQSVTGRQGVAYLHVILLAIYLKFPKKYSHLNCQKLPLSTTHSPLRPPPRGTPANVRIGLIFSKTKIITLHFYRWPYGSIFIQICAVGSKRRIFSATECVLAVQGRSRSSKVDDFGTNRKRVYDFLLVLHCDCGPIFIIIIIII